MKHAIILITLLAFLPLTACIETPSGSDCQPGDVDCADSDGKSDGWDPVNNPERLAKFLQYRLSALPLKGFRDTPAWKTKYPEAVGKIPVAWADTYWPLNQGSHNTRWQGPAIQSPLEKYDAAYNNQMGCATQPPMFGPGVKAQWDTYNLCAGSAARWQTSRFDKMNNMHDGIDNDNDGTIDDVGAMGVDGVEGWMGTCHAWSPASMLIPEPQHAVVVNGVRFEVGDIKAVIQNAFDITDSVKLGGECNGEPVLHDVDGSANEPCAGLNPGAMHVVMGNFLGINQVPLVEDRTAGKQVWNQPVMGYEVTLQQKVDAARANECVGATGDTWTYNPDANELYEVRMKVTYLAESEASKLPVGFMNNLSTDNYHYIVELGTSGGISGKVIGGRYCTDAMDRIDFLWAPSLWRPSNPSVDAIRVKELIKLSIAPQ